MGLVGILHAKIDGIFAKSVYSSPGIPLGILAVIVVNAIGDVRGC